MAAKTPKSPRSWGSGSSTGFQSAWGKKDTQDFAMSAGATVLLVAGSAPCRERKLRF